MGWPAPPAELRAGLDFLVPFASRQKGQTRIYDSKKNDKSEEESMLKQLDD